MKPEWEDRKLGDIIKLEYGKPLPQIKRKPSGLYPVYGANGVIGKTDEYYSDKQSIIVGRKGSAGEINLSEEKFWPLDVTYFVSFDSAKFDLIFIYFLLISLNLSKFAKGVKPGINRNEVYALDVKVPPLPEQRRIVAILDKAFAAIDKAKENSEKNLQNARELFESQLQSLFTKQGGGWEKYEQLRNLTDPDSPITYGVVKPGDKGNVLFIRGGDLAHGCILMTQLRTITKEVSQQYKRTLLRGGELLISLVGQPGQVAIAPKELAGTNIARQVGLIRLQPQMNADFIRLFLQSTIGQRALGARKTGSVQQVINLSELRQVQVPVPSIKIQMVIVEKLKSCDFETQRLQAIYEQKLADLGELKKSILHKAFAGEL